MAIKIPLWLRAYNSPFKTPTLKWYCGKTALGVPIFYPRKWRKYTRVDAELSAIEAMGNPRLVKKSYEEWCEYYKNYSKAVPLKIGFSSNGLGWKTKWERDDYRFEWSPRLSFVCFGYQIAVTVVAPHASNYWKSFLAYTYETDKTNSIKKRLEYCRKNYPNTWSSGSGKEKITTDYYKLILKNKWL